MMPTLVQQACAFQTNVANNSLIGPCRLHGSRKVGGKPGVWRLEYAVEKVAR